MGADGAGGPLLQREACGSRNPPTAELIAAKKHFMYMDGRAVFRWAVDILCDTIQDVLDDSRLTADDIDIFFPQSSLCDRQKTRNEPPPVCRRPFGLSYAAMAASSSMA